MLCAIYILFTAFFLWAAYRTEDSKSQTVWLFMPVGLQSSVLNALGWWPKLDGLAWIATYIILIASMIFILYVIGWCISRFISWSLD